MKFPVPLESLSYYLYNLNKSIIRCPRNIISENTAN